MRLDRHAGASRGPVPQPGRYQDIHDTAARQDGIVKVLTGLIFVVVSPGLAAAGILAVHALLPSNEFKLWAFILGVPGLLLAVFGLALIAWGAAKLATGRGQG
jgi:hypothetical protein